LITLPLSSVIVSHILFSSEHGKAIFAPALARGIVREPAAFVATTLVITPLSTNIFTFVSASPFFTVNSIAGGSLVDLVWENAEKDTVSDTKQVNAIVAKKRYDLTFGFCFILFS